MPNAAIIENGTVTNIIVADADFAASIGAISCDESVSIGWKYVSGEFVSPASEPVDLLALKEGLKASIDAQAERERYKYITPGSGQAMTYQAKASEAILYSRVGGLGEDYPLLTCEIGLTGETLADVAATVLAMHNQWLSIGGEIEKVRLTAKAQIDAALDEATARSIAPLWPVLA